MYSRLKSIELNHKELSVPCHSTELFCEKFVLLADGPIRACLSFPFHKKGSIRDEQEWSLIMLIKCNCAMEIKTLHVSNKELDITY